MARLWPTGIFCMADPQEYWPHRLLHIPSMTSVVRQGSDTYLVDNCRQLIRKPPYSVLSYTWGRYEKRPRKPEHRRLKVHGIDWDIPPIDETHFTVEDFESVIEVLRCRHEFAWIDIACIHQEDNLLKLQEIGQQGKIFQRAESAFIWLCRTTTRSLDHHSKSLKSVSDLFLEEVDYNFFEGPQSVLEAKKRVSEARYRSQEYENQVAQTLDTAIAAITELTKDPYFTSLWTLQEAMYHQSALTLSSDGSLVIPHPLGFGNLQAACPRKDSTVIQQRIQSIMALMSGVGYDPSAAKISNPHQSRAAAQHRRASLDQDRIFATMSLYGLTTRAAKDSSLKDPYLYSLDELEYAFAATLNSVSPSLGQVFTHVTAPEIGQTWKITADAKIADDHQIWTTNWRRWKTHCNIKATEVGHASFSGEVCPLSAFTAAAKDSEFHMMIDDYLIDQKAQLAEVVAQHRTSSLEVASFRLANALIHSFGAKNISILKLTVIGSASEGTLQCVIVRKSQDREEKYERIGICHTWPEPRLEWRRMEGLLY